MRKLKVLIAEPCREFALAHSDCAMLCCNSFIVIFGHFDRIPWKERASVRSIYRNKVIFVADTKEPVAVV